MNVLNHVDGRVDAIRRCNANRIAQIAIPHHKINPITLDRDGILSDTFPKDQGVVLARQVVQRVHTITQLEHIVVCAVSTAEIVTARASGQNVVACIGDQRII